MRPGPAVTPGRLRVWLLVFILLAATCLLPAAAGSATRPPSGPQLPSTPTVRLASVIEPAVLQPDAELRVHARITAGTESLPATTEVSLGLQQRALSSRSAVAGWASADADAPVGVELGTRHLGREVAAGQSTEIEVTVPASAVPLTDQDPWGPRALAVVLSDDDGERLDVLRTFVVWGDPETGEHPTLVTVIVPLTGGTADPATGQLNPLVQAREIRPDGRLDAALAAAAQPGVVIALDPMLLQNAVEPPPGEQPLPAELAPWREQLIRTVSGHETLVLGYADPDVNALAHAEQADLLRRGQELGAQIAGSAVPRHTTMRADIAFPPDGTADAESIAAYQEMGRGRALIVSEASSPLLQGEAMTQTGRAELTTKEGPLPTLVTDTTLSSTLADVADPDSPQGAAAAVQRLRADGAALTRETPGRSRHVLVTAPREWDPRTGHATSAMAALTQTPWTSAVGLQSLVDAEPGPPRAFPRIDADSAAQELPDFALSDLADTLTEIEGLAAILADPQNVSVTATAQAVSLTSFQWRGQVTPWQEARRIFASTAQSLRSAVHIVPGSPVTQVSRNVRLPVTVQNDASQPVRVVLDVTPQTNRLVVPERVTLDVPGNSRAVGYVPVRGVGNGDTSVRVQLLLTTGTRVGEPAVIRVRVRADWESKGAWTFGGAAGAVLLVGLVRSIRRGTRARRNAQAGAAAPAP